MGKARSAQEALQAEITRLTAQLDAANAETIALRADAQKATDLAAEASARAVALNDSIRKRRQALELISGTATLDDLAGDDTDDTPDEPDAEAAPHEEMTLEMAQVLVGAK